MRWMFFGFIILAALLSACTPQGGPAPQSFPLLKTGSEHMPGNIVEMEEIVIATLVLSAMVNLVTNRLHIPYTIGLVIVGFSLTFIQQLPTIEITLSLS